MDSFDIHKIDTSDSIIADVKDIARLIDENYIAISAVTEEDKRSTDLWFDEDFFHNQKHNAVAVDDTKVVVPSKDDDDDNVNNNSNKNLSDHSYSRRPRNDVLLAACLDFFAKNYDNEEHQENECLVYGKFPQFSFCLEDVPKSFLEEIDCEYYETETEKLERQQQERDGLFYYKRYGISTSKNSSYLLKDKDCIFYTFANYLFFYCLFGDGTYFYMDDPHDFYRRKYCSSVYQVHLLKHTIEMYQEQKRRLFHSLSAVSHFSLL